MASKQAREKLLDALLPFMGHEQPFQYSKRHRRIDAREAIFIFTTNTGHRVIPRQVCCFTHGLVGSVKFFLSFPPLAHPFAVFAFLLIN